MKNNDHAHRVYDPKEKTRPVQQVRLLPWLLLLAALVGGIWFAVRTVSLAVQNGFFGWLWDQAVSIGSLVILLGGCTAAIIKVLWGENE